MTTTPTSPLVDQPSLLIRLVADVLTRYSSSYQMSDEFAALLREDAELLAALQRLAFAVIQKGGVK